MYLKYLDQGLAVIPLRGKRPFIPNWERFSQALPTEDEAMDFEARFSRANIGLVCGTASRIVGIDLDVDVPEIKDLIPFSPVQRVGSKGFIRFYQADLKNPPISRNFKDVGVEILYNGRQAVLPPSIHPETKQPYIWTGSDNLFNHDLFDILPKFSLKDEEDLIQKLLRTEYGKAKAKNLPILAVNGRNNKLVEIISAMRSRGEQEHKIVQEVYMYDKTRHSPRLFMDPTEPYRAVTEDEAILAAWSMVNSVTKSLLRSKSIFPSLDFENQEQIFIMDEIATLEENQIYDPHLEYPIPANGLIREAVDIINKMSPRANPTLALGGAFSLLATLFSNRFRFQRIWTNMYILNIAETGAGKSTPQEFCKRVFIEAGCEDLLGFGGYRSGAAFIKNLSGKQIRLDIIDEVSSVFEMMKSKNSFQADLMEFMCAAWSSSNQMFIGHEQKTEETLSTAWNPCINVLGSTTEKGFSSSVSKMHFSKGLVPRFISFYQLGYNPQKEMEHCTQEIQAFSEKIKLINEWDYRFDIHSPSIEKGKKFLPYSVNCKDNAALELWKAIKYECGEEITEPGLYEVEKAMLTRKPEQIGKLAMILALSREFSTGIIPPPMGEGDFEYPIISVEDLNIATSIFDISFGNFRPVIIKHDSETDWQNDLNAIKELVHASRKRGIWLHAIVKQNTHIDLKRIIQILEQLKQSGDIIERVSVEQRKKRFFDSKYSEEIEEKVLEPLPKKRNYKSLY